MNNANVLTQKKVLTKYPKINYVLKGEPELVYVIIAKNIDLNKSLKTIDNLNLFENEKNGFY